MVSVAPALHVLRKSLWNPTMVDDVVRAAVLSARGTPRWLAVLHDGRVIGAVRGEPTRQVVKFAPMSHKQWCNITTYNALNAACKGGQYVQTYFFKNLTGGSQDECWNDAWPVGGVPASGGYTGTANTLRQFDNTTVGGLYYDRSAGAGQARYLVGWSTACNSASGCINNIILYDRVASYDGGSISLTPTTMTNTLAPTRYVSSGDEGLLVTGTQGSTSTALGSTASNLSAMLFTDQNGNAGVAVDTTLALTWQQSTPAASATFPAGVVIPSFTNPSTTTFPWLPLNANCSGVQQITSYTSSAANTGTICWVLLHPCATLWAQSGMNFRQELTRATFALETIFSNACMTMMFQNLTGNVQLLFGTVRTALT